ncbi:MAG: HXXEE domain-containing protein [Acidobacteriaceae bacterium]|nr:HXXEE domain-containing protein [Acidobacteriaceae bacterium]
MKFYRLHWYHVGGLLFVAIAYGMGFWGDNFNRIQVILVYSFMAMLLHQFEEYAMPGGFPGIANILLMGEKQAPDRYPLNANQVLISNVFLTYPFYVIPIFFPQFIWLGIMQIGQGLIQVPLHGVVMNVKMKTPYNPGMLSCVLVQLPIGVYYLWYVTAHHLASTTDYVLGSIAALLSIVVLWLGPIALLRSRASKYPFAPQQMYGYAADKVKATLRS